MYVAKPSRRRILRATDAWSAKRTAILAWLALWQLGLRVAPHRRSLPLDPDR